MDHDYTPADALPEGQAAALAFGIAVWVFFIPVIIAVSAGTLPAWVVWASAIAALAVFGCLWWGLTRAQDKRTWAPTTRPADWDADPTDTERTSA